VITEGSDSLQSFDFGTRGCPVLGANASTEHATTTAIAEPRTHPRSSAVATPGAQRSAPLQKTASAHSRSVVHDAIASGTARSPIVA
jgi:hypothetical protein